VLFRRLRLPIVAIALGLHLGIALFFPIPLFGLGFIALLVVFIDWGSLRARHLTPPPMESETRPVIPTSPHRRALGIAAIGLLLGCQALWIARDESAIPWVHRALANPGARFLAFLTGTERHPVFVDWHFDDPHVLIRLAPLTGGASVLPSFDDSGYPEFPLVSGRLWVDVLFGTKAYRGVLEDTEHALRRMIRGTTCRGEEVGEERQVSVEYRNVDIPLHLDFSLDDRLREERWHQAGVAIIVPPTCTITFHWEPGFVMEFTRPRKRRAAF
ncbi:MAG: hypothetical protein KDD44_07010, partial [Bdellovibrionales bacterium]|nr:hypothetical protein [Bdellovibrionales bacterium]